MTMSKEVRKIKIKMSATLLQKKLSFEIQNVTPLKILPIKKVIVKSQKLQQAKYENIHFRVEIKRQKL